MVAPLDALKIWFTTCDSQASFCFKKFSDLSDRLRISESLCVVQFTMVIHSKSSKKFHKNFDSSCGLESELQIGLCVHLNESTGKQIY